MKICQVRADLLHLHHDEDNTRFPPPPNPLPNFGKETTNQSDMAGGKSPVALALTG